MKETIIKSLGAGVSIGLCCEIYRRVENQYVGAFLFGIGLVTICMCQLNLFTGKVGSSNDVKTLSIIFVFNALGIFLMRAIFYIENPLSLAIGCGMLMQIGVVAFKKNMPYVTIMCIGAFLLAGFYHCIAKLYYPVTIQYPLMVLGNIIGAKLIYYLGVKQDS